MKQKFAGILIVALGVFACAYPPTTQAADDAKPKVRMPNLYDDVIEEAQRGKAMDIIKEYNPKLADLRKQIKTLTDERNKKLDALLSDVQKAKLSKARDAAKAARGKDDDND